LTPAIAAMLLMRGATRDRGTAQFGLDPSLKSVSEIRGISNYTQHQG
jgi:hypothetical protein